MQTLGVLFKAIAAFCFVWLAAPHQPGIGLGRPGIIADFVASMPQDPCRERGTCDGALFRAGLESLATIEGMRSDVLDGVVRVRAELRRTKVHP